MTTNCETRAASGGFTLLELVVVMGILSGFLIMLVQLVDTGLSLFTEGEHGQAMADRATAAQRVIGDELAALRGSSNGRDATVVTDRLLVQMLPIGLPARPERNATRVQLVRAAVSLAPDRELALVEARLLARVIEADPNLSEAEVAKKVEELRASEPLRGIGNLLLMPFRQADADDALVELRAGWFLPGQKIPVGENLVDPFEVVVPGSPELPGNVVYQFTQPILPDLLHCEFAFWSQRTQGWARGAQASGGRGPEHIWDSARGGWLVDEATGGEFALDRGPASLADPTDDIQPHAIRVTCVVAQPREMAAEGLLAFAIGEDETSLVLVDGERWPGPVGSGLCKIGGEWIGYAERRGDRLLGLKRGQRNTKAIEHAAGVRVHHGRQTEFVIPVPHRKDDWNG